MNNQTKPISRPEMDQILKKKRNQLKAIRTFDLLASSVGLIILSPFFLLVSLLIKIDSKGPIFYRQIRVGKDEKPFAINKFRTMQYRPQDTGSLITTKDDQRITKVGAILRKIKVDELPQLINIVRGDMGLVGPRPEVPKYVAYYDESARQVLRIRPGVTDLASIAFFDEASILSQADDIDQVYINDIMPIKHGLNYKYIRNMSLFFNIKVIFLTLGRILKRT